MNQRWYKRLNTWRDASEIIDTHAHEVAEIFDDSTAKAFVEEHHYSGTYPAARALRPLPRRAARRRRRVLASTQ